MVGLTFALFAALGAEVVASGPLASRDLKELSGLALSRADPTVLWGHNDSGSGPVLYRIGLQGEDLGDLMIPEATAGDWEDIAAFEDRGGPALLIGDVGDNLSFRSFVTLYAVRDPGRGRPAPLLWRMDVSFPDGQHDCEAIAVDPLSRDILLLTKRDDPPRLYRVPLPTRAPQARRIAEFVGTLAPRPRRGVRQRLLDPYALSPTALALSADGLTAAIVSYEDALIYRRRAGQPWIELFSEPTAALPLPAFGGIEAAALSADGRTLWIGSEGRPGQWARIALP